jgi:hypothetical protein
MQTLQTTTGGLSINIFSSARNLTGPRGLSNAHYVSKVKLVHPENVIHILKLKNTRTVGLALLAVDHSLPHNVVNSGMASTCVVREYLVVAEG